MLLARSCMWSTRSGRSARTSCRPSGRRASPCFLPCWRGHGQTAATRCHREDVWVAALCMSRKMILILIVGRRILILIVGRGSTIVAWCRAVVKPQFRFFSLVMAWWVWKAERGLMEVWPFVPCKFYVIIYPPVLVFWILMICLHFSWVCFVGGW